MFDPYFVIYLEPEEVLVVEVVMAYQVPTWKSKILVGVRSRECLSHQQKPPYEMREV